MVDPESVIEGLRKVFGGAPEGIRVFRSPGRVNLIGDHIDYAGGTVLPMALDRGTWLAVRPRADGALLAHSANFADDGVKSAHTDETGFDPGHGWFSYLLGVLDVLRAAGHRLPHGLDMLLVGDIPHGAGLSSSASVELAMAVAANAIGGFGLTGTELALIGQRAENEYVGVACGIMDQLAVARGRRGSAILMDCDTLRCDYVPFPAERAAVVVIDSRRRRSLSESAYNERRAEVERALGVLRRRGLPRLVELQPAELAAVAADLGDAPLRRARHVMTEQQRVLAAAEALRRADLPELGRLMRQSHESLRDDFGVTGPHLDALAGAAWEAPGVIGARMTGAGFGGCTVNLVRPDRVADFVDHVRDSYRGATGLEPEFHLVHSAAGAAEVTP